MAPASARKPTENRKPIAANRGSPAPSRLARPASAGVPRWFTESVAAVAELPATPRGAFAFARGASRNSVEASIAESEASRRRAEAIRGDQRTETVGVRARERAGVAPASIEGAEAGVSTEVDVAPPNAPPRRAPANGPGMIDFAPPRLSTARRTRVDVRSRPTVTRPSTAAPSVSRRTAETTRTAARPIAASGVSPRRDVGGAGPVVAGNRRRRRRRARTTGARGGRRRTSGFARGGARGYRPVGRRGGVRRARGEAARGGWRRERRRRETRKKTAAGAEARNSAARVAAERASAASRRRASVVLGPRDARRRRRRRKRRRRLKISGRRLRIRFPGVRPRRRRRWRRRLPSGRRFAALRRRRRPEEIARAVARVAADVARNLQATNVEGDEDKNEGARTMPRASAVMSTTKPTSTTPISMTSTSTASLIPSRPNVRVSFLRMEPRRLARASWAISRLSSARKKTSKTNRNTRRR